MKIFFNTVNIFLLAILLSLSGCNVADEINKNILDIETEDDTNIDNKSNSKSEDKKEEDKNPKDDENLNGVDTNITESNESINVGDDSNLTLDNNDSNSNNNGATGCPVNQHVENNQCVPDIASDIVVNEFNLTFPDYENVKSINIVMGMNDTKTITIRSDPEQVDTSNKMKFFQFTNNDVVTPYLFFDGAPQVAKNYDFSFKMTSENLTGKDEFQLTLDNANGFTDSVYINVEVIDQISLYGVRSKYTLVTDGDDQNITIRAYNLFNNPLKFEIVNQDVIIDEKKLLIIINGSSIFSKDTKDGIDFTFSARGLEDESRDVEIRVKDTITGTVESIFITLESVRRNTQFYVDLYECGEDYGKNYEETTDSNTPTSQDGIYSADRAIYLKSIHEMDYDIGNKFSTVMLFHPTNGTEYAYDIYGKEYLTNLDNGKKIAVLYYASHLQGVQYFLKYYNEDKNSIVCEKRFFGNIGAVSEQPDSLEGRIIPDLSQMPVGPVGL